ncbi:hypothetical protein [Saccharopolyspora sp. CA-218241]|uniref:hypothetical protein n=1 Tax=Saccharopolyspora sp. CA-218241 TaxID=3240027 RepID=UPI003D9560F0
MSEFLSVGQMSDLAAIRFEADPDYFSLRVRQALSGGPADDDDEPEARVLGEIGEIGEQHELADHPEVVEAEVRVVDAESAVLAAEDAGHSDEVAMARLDRARRERDAVLVRLQQRRAVAHTVRAESRAAQVVPMRRRFAVIAGGEAA